MSDNEISRRILNGTCTVLGLGISNTPLLRVLLSMGARVTVRDRKPVTELGDAAAEFLADGVRFITGETYLDGITEDVIFRSPGIRPDACGIPDAVRRGALLTSEMEWFLEATPATVIGVTGSDGKTTTTTVTALMLRKMCEKTGRGTVYIGGNIGQPLLPEVGKMSADDFAVVELSSFQLMTVTHSPVRSAVTNLSPNHLNWHPDMEEYAAAKRNIFSHPGARLVVLNAENEWDRKFASETDLPVTFFSSKQSAYRDIVPAEKNGCCAVYERDGKIYLSDGAAETYVLDSSEIFLPGRHNLENYMTAIALVWGLVTPDIIRGVAKNFSGVEHRLEYVRTVGGVKYYNSSIDSSPSRTVAALSAISGNPIVILGGRDKHVPFDPLAEVLVRRAKAAVLTGEAREQICEALLRCPDFDPKRLPLVTEPDFTNAVEVARRLAVPGDTVLLSPACTSFDAFRNFEERGNAFKWLVSSWKE